MTEFPPFRMDVANRCLWHRGDGPEERRILLTPKAFAMLRYLVEHAGRLVTQEEMLSWLGIGLRFLWLSTPGTGVLRASFHKSETAKRLRRICCSSWSKIHIYICAASWFSSSLS
jgi:hypothetical protein